MHTQENSSARPTLLAIFANPRPDFDPDTTPDAALAASIAANFPGSYIEEDERGEPRVCFPAAWLQSCARSMDSIIGNFDQEIEGMRADLGMVA